MVNKNFHYRWDFIGLSTDTKPTPATSEKVVNGSTFYCSDNSKLYVWYKDQWYERTAAGGGGGTSDFDELTNRPKYNGTAMTSETDIPLAPTVVQTTGNSTTDVMSQNATTSMIYADATTEQLVQIGHGANAGSYASKSGRVAIGYNASATGHNDNIAIGHVASATSTSGPSIGIGAIAKKDYTVVIGGIQYNGDGDNNVIIGSGATVDGSSRDYCVAIGNDARCSRRAEVNIGTGTSTTKGYNNTPYRLLGGVHDGQDAHDAVTVGQINALIDAINTATSSNIPHIGS